MKDFNLDDLDIDLSLGDFDIGLDFDLPNFETSTQSEKPHTTNRYTLPKQYKQRAKTVKYEHAAYFAKDVGKAILDGERVNALLSGNFIFGDFIEALCVQHDVVIDELQLSTLSVSQDNIDSFHNLLNWKMLKSLEIIVSDYWWSHNRANAPYIYEKLDLDNKFQFAVAGTHTKITLIRIGDKKIVISGSANLRSSRSVEEIQIETNPDLYDFHHEWQSRILKTYGMIDKAQRGGDLFELLTVGMTQDRIDKQIAAFKRKSEK